MNFLTTLQLLSFVSTEELLIAVVICAFMFPLANIALMFWFVTSDCLCLWLYRWLLNISVGWWSCTCVFSFVPVLISGFQVLLTNFTNPSTLKTTVVCPWIFSFPSGFTIKRKINTLANWIQFFLKIKRYWNLHQAA